MDRDGDDRIDTRRRWLSKRLGLAVGTLYAAPVLMKLTPAHASGSGGGGSGGGGGFSGGNEPQIQSFSRPSRPVRRARAPRPEIVVAATQDGQIDQIAALGFTLIARDTIGLVGAELARFRLPANVTVDQARTQIGAILPEALVDPNHIYTPGELPCGDNSCAAFDLIGWRYAGHACPTGTVVGIIDTTVNADHAALLGVAIEKLPVLAEGRQPASAVHGTAIAILIGGRADTRTPGLLDGVRMVAAEAFHRNASGQDQADAFDVARAIDRLVAANVPVINLSFTGPDNAILRRVVEAALARNVILVAAAGNSGPLSDPLYPAAIEGVVAVTAIDARRRVYRQANAGDHIDFAAPGVQLWTAASVSGGRYRSGTSYAAPFVSAALAAARARRPTAAPSVLIEDLQRNAIDLGEPGRDATFGWGLIQAGGTCGAGGEVFMPASATE